jgi:hypothetical protein
VGYNAVSRASRGDSRHQPGDVADPGEVNSPGLPPPALVMAVMVVMAMVMMVMAMMMVVMMMIDQHHAATLVNVKAMIMISANDPRAEMHLRGFRSKRQT